MPSRRSFIKNTSIFGITTQIAPQLATSILSDTRDSGIDWAGVRATFPISTWDKIQLNSGSAGVMPSIVRDNLIELIKYVNSKAPYEVWGEWQTVKKDNLSRLSELTGCRTEELQIVRNTTEALNMIIYGLRLEPEDEVVIAKHDYPFARNAWYNRANRDGFKIREIDIILPAPDEEVLEVYKSVLTEKTKIVHVTQITHREGHILPVKELSAMAHLAGAEVVVDGAHAVGQIEVNLSDLNCDYFASSLHKWLNAPLGTGLLFAKKDKISTLYNHPSSNLEAFDRMDKYEHLGTRSWSNEIGISAALDYHDLIGSRIKLDRLQELKEYWMESLDEISNVVFQTNRDPKYSAAVATFRINNLSGGEIRKRLNKEFNIHAKSVGGTWGSGVRVSPNIFTTKDELNHLTMAIANMAKK